MRELAVQAASGTLDDTERAYLETEFQAISSDLGRIRDTTEFNGIKLLDGSTSNSAATLTDTVGTLVIKAGSIRVNGVMIDASVDDGKSSSKGSASALSKANALNQTSAQHGVVANATNQQIGLNPVLHGGGLALLTIDNIAVTTDPTLRATGNDADGLVRRLVNAITDQTGVWADVNSTGQLVLTAVDGRNFSVGGGVVVGFTPSLGEVSFDGQLSLRSESDFVLSGNTIAINIGTGTYTKDAGLSVQVGKHNTSDDRLNLGLESSTRAGVLQLDDLSLSSQAAAALTLEFIDHGMDHTNKQHAKVGAAMSRLEISLTFLTTQEQNLTTAESQITDTDMALESAALARANILRAASESVLAQAKDLSRATVRLIE
jgi:flagellin